MPDFTLTEEQRQIRDLAREFAQQEIAPAAAHHDRTGEFPRDICRKAWELGLMNTHIPEAYGGPGLGVFEGCLVAEEVASGCTGIGTAMEANTLAEAPVIVAGNDDQKKRYLAPMTREFKFAAYCVTEPDAGSDVAGIKTLARRVGSDYALTGAKMWITNGSVADWYFVLAYTDPDKKHRGMSAFVVDRSSPGIEVGKKEWNMGQHASDTRALSFTDVKVPGASRLGNEGDGFKIAMTAFDHTRPIVSAAAVGLARSAMDHAVRYAQERRTFGAPIAAHQAVSFMIAEMAMNIEAARLLVWQSACTIDRGERNTRQAAFAKAFAADMAMKTALDAVQVFGGYGFSSEYPVEKLMRDAKVFQIYEGTSQIQRLIIAKEIFERR
ncbi:MAG TPA: acyl-CoA dehydrogenase family protein [Candidatus Polarisedimenticolia bacterium]|nr:acyl-CoA dehydrogenase family protein [Candidatus Polarisedimenticolia bacterium]